MNHHRMVSLGYTGACLALTTSIYGMANDEETDGLPEVKLFTMESYERGLNMRPVMRHYHDIYATVQQQLHLPTLKGVCCES
jgi:hypothetical protein